MIEDIKKDIQSVIEEKKQIAQQISEIESQRTQLAQERNFKKSSNIELNLEEIRILGQKISDLGNKSQELQYKFDAKFINAKLQINLKIDNLIAEEIRRIRKIDEQIQELTNNNKLLEEKSVKYSIQKQDFFARFGRMPELSKDAMDEDKAQQDKYNANNEEISKLKSDIKQIEEKISEIARIKNEFKNGNVAYFTNNEQVEEIEEQVENIGPEVIEEVIVEKIDSKEIEKEVVDNIEPNENANIIENEIIREQEIITLEDEKKEEPKQVKSAKIKIENIIIKVEAGELVYKAYINNGETIKVYPIKEKLFLKDRENREKIKKILIGYSIEGYRNFDRSIIRKLDPIVCKILQEFAYEYNNDYRDLMYNYAMTFSNIEESDIKLVPNITYNISFINEVEISKKERRILGKICRKACQNDQIETIGIVSKFNKAKYLLRQIINMNQVDKLPEGKNEKIL